MENNYTVYQHVTPDGLYYFGQTQNVEKRWSNNGIHYKETSLYPYIEKFGWDNIQHIVLFRDQTRENALWIENFLIETAREDGVCINKQRSGLISKEEEYQQQYYEQNKDKILEKQKQYYEENKDKRLEYKRQYYEKNKDKIIEYQEKNKDKIVEYREKNKEKKREYAREYYEKNREKRREQIKQYQEQNKDKLRKYQREYYKRKKLEKQLKEVETTLF